MHSPLWFHGKLNARIITVQDAGASLRVLGPAPNRVGIQWMPYNAAPASTFSLPIFTVAETTTQNLGTGAGTVAGTLTPAGSVSVTATGSVYNVGQTQTIVNSGRNVFSITMGSPVEWWWWEFGDLVQSEWWAFDYNAQGGIMGCVETLLVGATIDEYLAWRDSRAHW